MRIQTIEIVKLTEALCCIVFIVKVACYASSCVEKCGDLAGNLKMSLNIIHIFMSNRPRHISEMALCP